MLQEMHNAPFCRLCLRTDRSLEEVDETLSTYYNELLDYFSISTVSTFCWECKHYLKKWHKFKDRCIRSKMIYQKWMENKDPNKTSIHLLHNSLDSSPLGVSLEKNSKTCDVIYNGKLDSLTADTVNFSDTNKVKTGSLTCTDKPIKIKVEDVTYTDVTIDESLIKLEASLFEESEDKFNSLPCMDDTFEESDMIVDPLACVDSPVNESEAKYNPRTSLDTYFEDPLLKLSTSKNAILNTNYTEETIARKKIHSTDGPAIKRNMPIDEILYRKKKPPKHQELNKPDIEASFNAKTVTVSDKPKINEATTSVASKSNEPVKKLMLKKKKPVIKPALKIMRFYPAAFSKNPNVEEALIMETKLPDEKKQREDPVLKVNVPFVEPVAKGMLTVGPITCRQSPKLEIIADIDNEQISISHSNDITPLIIKTDSLVEEILPD